LLPLFSIDENCYIGFIGFSIRITNLLFAAAKIENLSIFENIF